MKGALALLAVGGLLAACAGPAPRDVRPFSEHREGAGLRGACARYMAKVEAEIDRRGVRDAAESQVPGYPYLRVNRLLAGLRARAAARAEAYDYWVDELTRLDAQARAAELASLVPPPPPPALAVALGRPRAGPLEVWRICARRLEAHDLRTPRDRARVMERAVVPPSYRSAWRWLGLYPLTSVPFLLGVERLHRQFRQVFARPRGQLAVHGRLRRYRPAAPDRALASFGPRAGLVPAEADPLGRPQLAGRALERLFVHHAPVWEIDHRSSDDRPGPLIWGTRRVEVGRGRAVVYRRVSHTVFEGRVLLQLNYVIWFPARTARGLIDLLAGHLDGITWRVTLDRDGLPLLYDAMHNCGCYHLFIPTERLARRPQVPAGWEEPILVPQTLAARGERVVIRLEGGTHYLQRVYRAGEEGNGERYQLRPYAELRSLRRGGEEPARASAFAPDGLVPSSRRPERWLFWPMGVLSAGAMRQWGNHATAFVGRRHFDDPDLIERYFRRARGARFSLPAR